ncbi:alpha/beta hydrolase [Pseudonocardiaceae bacterium YIM PH 21723]|nr:alpha/beta hydrolase [Pseudonocardiaceae bacterium YIM PH 21723]
MAKSASDLNVRRGPYIHGLLPRPFTTSDGVRLQVIEQGPVDSAITVILCHGWTMSREVWRPIAAALPDACGRPVRIIYHDYRGHGGSDPAPFGTANIERNAEDLAELIEARVPAGRVVLVGHSMGGMTIMALAQQHPKLFAKRVAGVGFVSTSSGGLDQLTLGMPARMAELVKRMEAYLRTRFATTNKAVIMKRAAVLRPGIRLLTFGRKARKTDVHAAALWLAKCHPATVIGFRESLNLHNRLEALSAFRNLPVELLVGDKDKLTPLSHSRKIARELPEATFTVYPDAGHMLPQERVGEVTARIAALIKKV